MISRRTLLAALGAAAALPASASPFSRPAEYEPILEEWVNDDGEGGMFPIPEALRTREVIIPEEVPAGEIHIMAEHHALLYTLGGGRAMRYAVALGVDGRQFKGRAFVNRKEEWPSWMPSANMIRQEPDYAQYASGVTGGLHNPMGARSLYLFRNGRDTRYRIHGTSQPWTIGKNVSSGCVRLFNSAVIDLYERSPLGTEVLAY